MTGGRARMLRYLGFLIAAAVLAFVIIAARPAEVWKALGDVQGTKPWLVIALNLVVIALWTARSMLLVRHMGHRMPFSVLLPVTILGNVAGSLTPGGSGEVLRAAALQRSAGFRLGESVTLVAYERVLSTYLLGLSTLASLALISLGAGLAAVVVLACLVFAFVPWVCAVLLLPRLPASSAVEPAGLPRKLLRYGLALAEELRVLLVSLPLLLAWSVLTVLSFAVIAWQFSLVAGSLAVDLDVLQSWIAFGGSGFAAIVSLLPLGIGVGDGSIAAIIHQAASVPFERATATAVLIRATVTLPLLLLAFVSYVLLQRMARPGQSTAAEGRQGTQPGGS